MWKYFLFIYLFFSLLSCQTNTKEVPKSNIISELEKREYKNKNHSYSNINEVNTKHLHLELEVNFENQVIEGVARHQVINNGGDKVIFDVRQLNIKKVTIGKEGEEIEVEFFIGNEHSIFGSPLVIPLKEEDTLINIYYATTPESEALGWMTPQMTSSKKFPFLYTQGEAILTRTWIPIQDTPKNRLTYSANIKVPNEFMAVMSADNPTVKNTSGEYSFVMNQPISCYLIALAVGDLKYHSLDERCGVYAESEVIKVAADEFIDIPKMVNAAEKLYGKYQWGKFDVLVLPYSFPFGGMENPKLTFLTPTLISGDKSLVSVIAHELAHSWSGNLVTNSTWDDFWLNEGFTVYFENRIMEEVEGKEVADMLALIELQEMEHTIQKMREMDEMEETKLKLNLEGRNPDDGMTDIAYIKGAYFLKTLENKVGREKFDKFLSSYFHFYQFKTVTTEEFVTYLKENLLDKHTIDFNLEEWIYHPGIPKNGIEITSDRFVKMEQLAQRIKGIGTLPSEMVLGDKTTQEWLAFIRAFERELDVDKMNLIDKQLNFSNCGNAEIMCEWFVLGIQNGYNEIRPQTESFLMQVGRRKYLEPLYEAIMEKGGETLTWGRQLYQKARPNYHAISFNTVDEILDIK